jgi:transcriptional antiterminator RfaH
MPLLPLEPFVFPQDLLTKDDLTLSNDSRWWVLHTRPRAEKSLARRLLARQTPFFLPLYHHQWKNRGRLFQSYLPLFPGYVFLNGDGQARLAALETNLVAGCLPVVDQGQLHSDLVRVHQMITAGEPLTPEERMGPGAAVEIVNGPLAGLEGVIQRRANKLRFVVEVRLLQRGVSVEVEKWMIRPLGEQSDALCPASTAR